MKDPATLEELICLFLHHLWRDCLHLLTTFILMLERPHCVFVPETEGKDKRLWGNTKLCSPADTCLSISSIDELNSEVEEVVHCLLKCVLKVFYGGIRFGLLLCIRYPLKVKNHGYYAFKMVFEVRVGLHATRRNVLTPTCSHRECGSPTCSHRECGYLADGSQLKQITKTVKKAGHHQLDTLFACVAMLAVLPVLSQFAVSIFPDDNRTNMKSDSTSRYLLLSPAHVELISVSECDPYFLDLRIFGRNVALRTVLCETKHKVEKLTDITFNIRSHSHGNTTVNVQSHSLAQVSHRNVTLSNCTATGQYSASDVVSFSCYFLAACSALWNVLLMAPKVVQSRPIRQPFKNGSQRERGAKSLFRGARASDRSLVVDLQGGPNTGYCAVITIGRAATQEFCVLVDTGSSNLAVAAASQPEIDSYFNTQIPDNSYVSTNKPVSVTYTGGDWSGTLVRDAVSIGGSPQVEVEFALITSSSKFFIPGAPWVGILGLAYESLAKPDSSVETYWSVLQRSSGLRDIFAISLCPQVGFVNQGGVMEFGDISETLYTGPILYTTIVKERYYGVLVTNMTVGHISIDLPCSEFNNDKAIVDSGTTDIYLPVKTFEAVVEAFTQYFADHVPLFVPESFWKGGSKLAWPTEDQTLLYSSFPTFYIGFAQHENSSMEFSLAVTPQTYLRQVSGSHEEQTESNCLPACDFFVFGIKGRERGMVVGANVMLGFATVFDREQQRVGFAKSTCQYETTSQEHLPHIIGPYNRDPVDCECHNCSPGLAYWEYIVYICGGIVFPIALFSVIYAVTKKIIKCLKKRNNTACCSSGRVLCCNTNCSNGCGCGCKKLICVGRTSRNYRATETDEVNSTSVLSEDEPSLYDRDSGIVTNETSISSETSLVCQRSVEDDLEDDQTEIGVTNCEQETFEHSIPCEEQNTELEEHSVGIACTEQPCTELDYATSSWEMNSTLERREPTRMPSHTCADTRYVYVKGHRTAAGHLVEGTRSVLGAIWPTSRHEYVRPPVDLIPSESEGCRVQEDHYYWWRRKEMPIISRARYFEAANISSDC